MWLGIPLFRDLCPQDAETLSARSMARLAPKTADVQAPWLDARPPGLAVQRWEWSGSFGSGLDLALLETLLPLEPAQPRAGRCCQPPLAQPVAAKPLIPPHASIAP